MSPRNFQIGQMPLIVKQIIKPFCLLFLISIYVNESKSKDIQQPSTGDHVVVFDVEETLCKPNSSSEELKFAEKKHPECPIIHWKHDGKDYPYIFLPYLQILFDYLLEKGVRVVFFSSAVKERSTVIPELLASFWGNKKCEELKSKGQFAIFSREDMRKGSERSEEGLLVKDLNVVVQNGESVSDCLLVEDDPSYTAHGQQPCLQTISLGYWPSDNRPFPVANEFPKNSVYYMLGLFKTYFEHEKYKKLPLREGFRHILPTEEETEDYIYYFEEHPFARKMIELGLSAVKSKVPNATLYGSFKEKKWL